MRTTTGSAARWARAALLAVTLVVAVAQVASAQLGAQGPPLAVARLEALAQGSEAGGWGALARVIQSEEPTIYLHPERARAALLAWAEALEAGKPDEGRRLAAARLRHRISRLDHYLGQADEASRRVEALGLLTQWQVAGPFENANMSGFDAGYGPEDPFDPAATFEGKVGAVGWQGIDALVVRGYARFDSAVNPDRSVAVYAATAFDAGRGGKAVLRLGTHGAYKVWLNGQRLGRVDTDLGAELDRDAYGVTLKPGVNTLLIKVAGENRGQLGVYARWTGVDGSPLVFKPAPVPRGAALGTPEAARGTFNVVDPATAAAASARKSGTAGALVDAALIARSLRELDPATPWRDLADEAIKLATRDPRVLDAAASVSPDHWRRLDLRRSASEAAPRDGWLKVELAYEVNQSVGLGHLPHVMRLADEAVALADGGPQGPAVLPRLLKARLLNGQGLVDDARVMLEPLVDRHPGCQPLGRTLHSVYEGLGREREALALDAKLLETRRLVPGEVTDHAGTLLRGARPAEALAALDALLVHRPDALNARLLRARALQQLDRADEALAAIDGALALSPGRVSFLKEKGELLEELGRPEEAAAVYEVALGVAPEDLALLDRLRALRPEQASFEAAWRLGDEALVPSDDAAQVHAGQDYYFLAQQAVVHVAPSGRASRFNQTIVHVLTDEGARNWSGYRFYYSPGFERVELVSVRVRKADGTLNEAYRRADYDAGKGAGNLYYLRRFAMVEVPPLAPGDVVEYAWREMEVGDENYREGYFGDLWYFDSSVDVERARYVVLTPQGMTLHTRAPQRAAGLDARTEEVSIKEQPHTAHIFEAADLPRVRTDSRMPGSSEIYDYVLVSTYKTWEEVGLWWWNLIKDQLVIDAEIEALVKDITKGLRTDEDKTRAIYNWVVENTRYVGIEFGVHGWKPYRTTLCLRRKFGDCKDKASLIKVMLNAAGIEAHMVLIRTRRLGEIAESPANLAIFNHAIAYVPGQDLYLDGTAEFHGSRELPFSDQGQLTVIVADGGKVTVRRAPLDAPDVNRNVRILNIDLSGVQPVVEGELEAVGADAAYYRSQFESQEKRNEVLEQLLSRTYPGARLKEATFAQVAELEKPVRVKFSFTGGGFVKQIGDTQVVFLAGRELRMLDSYAPQASRDQDLTLNVPHTFENRVTYRLAPGQRLSAPPPPSEASGSFGSYRVGCQVSGQEVTCEVVYRFSVDRVAASDYAKFRQWLGQMDQALNQRLTLEDGDE